MYLTLVLSTAPGFIVSLGIKKRRKKKVRRKEERKEKKERRKREKEREKEEKTPLLLALNNPSQFC